MKLIKESCSFAADVTICFLFALLVLIAWPFVDGDESVKEEGGK